MIDTQLDSGIGARDLEPIITVFDLPPTLEDHHFDRSTYDTPINGLISYHNDTEKPHFTHWWLPKGPLKAEPDQQLVFAARLSPEGYPIEGGSSIDVVEFELCASSTIATRTDRYIGNVVDYNEKSGMRTMHGATLRSSQQIALVTYDRRQGKLQRTTVGDSPGSGDAAASEYRFDELKVYTDTNGHTSGKPAPRILQKVPKGTSIADLYNKSLVEAKAGAAGIPRKRQKFVKLKEGEGAPRSVPLHA